MAPVVNRVIIVDGVITVNGVVGIVIFGHPIQHSQHIPPHGKMVPGPTVAVCAV